MSWFTKWSFANKAAVTLVTLIVLILGVLSYFRMPMEFLPKAETPQIRIIAMGQGVNSKSMETDVTSPIEQSIAAVTGKSGVLSTTGDGYSKIDVFFEYGTDMDQARQDVQELVDSVSLPNYVSKPSVTKLDTSSIPISFVAITFKDGITAENLDFVKEKLEPIYRDTEGVAEVQIQGVEDSFVSIQLDREELDELQIPVQTVIEALQGQDGSFAVGENIIEGNASNITVVGNIDSLEDLENITVSKNVQLEDIAIIQKTRPGDVINRFNGEDSIEFTIVKDSTSNAVTLSEEVDSITKEISDKYDNLEATVYLTTADMVKSSVQSMIKEVLIGALFATIVIMLFLRKIRSTFITIVSIPLSLCITLILLSQSGITLNILTLGGVAVAVGRLVDDSIVVIENIFKKMQQEKFSVGMIIDATREVGGAITVATLTTVAVFLPIGLVNGSLQEFILPFALTITYSLLASLLVALTVVPLMSAGLLKGSKLTEYKPPVRFRKVVNWSLSHKFITLTIALLLFFGSIGAYFVMPKGVVDDSSTDYIQATLKYPSDTPLKKVTESTLKLESKVQKIEGVKHVITYLGNSSSAVQSGVVKSPTEAQVRVLLSDEEEVDRIMEEIEQQQDLFSGADYSVVAASFLGSTATDINIDVTGDNLENIEDVTNEIVEQIEDVEGIEEVTTNQQEKKSVYSFEVNSAKINTEQVASQLGILLNKTPIGTIDLQGEKTNIVLEPLLSTETEEDLEDISILSEDGPTPITEVASLKSERTATNQYHKDGEPFLQVTAKIDPTKLSEINADIRTTIFGDGEKNGIKIPEDVEVFIGGANVQQSEDFNDLFMTMGISIGLVFLILVVTYKGIKTPIAILITLPLALIGSIVGLLITGISVDTTVLLGALMLIGIVVTNAIVLLDRVKQNEKAMSIRESLLEASQRRLRPIIMTAISTISAMIPLLFGTAETGSLVSKSLAVVVIGGLTISTLLTLVVIPCVYELLHTKERKRSVIEKN
ncbi:efflux RND transporter permease subunit [Virgibacillus salarius]|uniref:efflux RND transporter permease subunit n=1 Tax=Virgibacillus TaxID=84406 RepID=UPI00047EAAB5|nr:MULTISPECIES: efflux RND transporter permease subunit [Bacillaceae]MDY7044805.1 efflux RND transporter permease subunit [Virgibacillus sp. M23]